MILLFVKNAELEKIAVTVLRKVRKSGKNTFSPHNEKSSYQKTFGKNFYKYLLVNLSQIITYPLPAAN